VIDTHVHLHRDDFADDRDEVFARARAAGVRGFLEVGYDLDSSERALALARERGDVRATVGVHPHDAQLLADADGRLTADGRRRLDRLAELAAADEVVAIGEIGLDFYRDLSPRPAQRAALEAQLELAARVGLPVVFHVRDAYPETLALVDAVGLPPRGGVLHSFAGEVEHARWARARGCVLGIGGPVTYKNSKLPAVLREAGVRADEVLLETDAPWLPPVPYRGKRNEPAYLVHTRDGLAATLATTPERLAEAADRNAERVFGPWPGLLDAGAGAAVE
jgi:TatD DNase family protein